VYYLISGAHGITKNSSGRTIAYILPRRRGAETAEKARSRVAIGAEGVGFGEGMSPSTVG